MQRRILACVLIIDFIFSWVNVSAWELNPAQEIRESGTIHGFIDYCGSSGSFGFEIFIPGKSFFVRTGASGEFNLSHVPEGVYNLMLMRSGSLIKTIEGVPVVKKSITELNTIEVCPDNDNDGYDQVSDCNDDNPNINPGATESCDGIDNNCDGNVDEISCQTCTDNDNDGFFAQDGCGTPVDCNDSNPSVNPGTDEICGDDIDNDCDREVEEGCSVDVDLDGYPEDIDCNDTDPAINPGAPELCGDDIDNNCDGTIDEYCTCQPPSITDVMPSGIEINLGGGIVITGTNFYSDATVKIYSETGEEHLLESVFIDASSIEATVPAGLSAREYSIKVSNDDGCDSTIIDALTLYSPE